MLILTWGFAGIATCISTFSPTGGLGEISWWVFGLNVGPLPVDLEWQERTLKFAWMTQRLPEFGPVFEPVVAPAIGVEEQAIAATGLPIQQVSCGVPFVIVPIDTRASVDAAVPGARALAALAKASAHDHFSVYLLTMDRGNDAATTHSRMFGPGLGIVEDPATGSASGRRRDVGGCRRRRDGRGGLIAC